MNEYQACYGPGWSEGVRRKKENYDFYEISIERINPKSSTVLFSKRFPAVEVKSSVLDRRASDIVKVDVSGEKIFFHIQEKPYVVELSKHKSSN